PISSARSKQARRSFRQTTAHAGRPTCWIDHMPRHHAASIAEGETMGKVDAPYLVTHTNKDGTQRHYFAPRQEDRKRGSATGRLHDRQQRVIRDPIEAAAACRAVAAIYMAWRRGEPGKGPHLIDQLGRVVEQVMPQRKVKPNRLYRPGQIGAMVE